ncbi:MAG: hypothetical protein K0Q49_2178 [Haloplasmataceae bacterium]|jgi:hypothetical protein|nr:hypothetical protein [Haloplasmataceae bacterium]
MAVNKWRCTYGNAKKVRPVSQGRPDPGKCPRK